MKMVPTNLAGVMLLEPRVFEDPRGCFYESYNERAFREATGVAATFVQDNHSCSGRGVLRGLHYQLGRPQGKLVRVVAGRVWDVAVDLRRSSPTFGRWSGVELSAENRLQVWIPPGFAHGFAVVGEGAEVLYKTTDFWSREDERAIRWDDPDLAIDWPLAGAPVLSAQDAAAPRLRDAEVYR